VLLLLVGVLAGLSVAVRPQRRASASPCPAGALYVERVMGGWKQTSFHNLFGLCLNEHTLANDLIRQPTWRDRLLALFRTPEARAAGGTTYYVATTGEDSRSCTEAQNINTPRKTIESGIQCLFAGDTLLIRGGTYASTEHEHNYLAGIRGGTSWENAVTVKGYPGEQVTIGGLDNVGWLGPDASYVIVEHFIMEQGGIGGGSHVRFKD